MKLVSSGTLGTFPPGQQRVPITHSILGLISGCNEFADDVFFPPLSKARPSFTFVCQSLVPSLLPPQRSRSHISSISHSFSSTLFLLSFPRPTDPFFANFLDCFINHTVKIRHL